MIAVSDTTPLNYLVLIDCEEILPQLFSRVIIPPAVLGELQHEKAPSKVQSWVGKAPTWLHVHALSSPESTPILTHLDEGERQAIGLAEELEADWLLLDERAARQEAHRRRQSFIGTLGILRRAAQWNLIDLGESFGRLQRTTFHVNPSILQFLLDEQVKRRGDR